MLMSVMIACDLNEDTTKSAESKEDESSVLTVDNCPDLEAVLYSKEASGKDFAKKYDGCRVRFEATVFGINDAVSGVYANIDESVEMGDLVIIEGVVDESWTDYYNCLYIETESLSKK